MDSTYIVNIATPVIVPLIIAGFKRIKPNIPTWALPVIAPFLGVLMGIIANASLQYNENLLLAAALGLAGVGVREVVDQLKPTPEQPPKIIGPNP